MSGGARPAQASLWDIDPDIAFLNHGSFGACPRPVLASQTRWRARMERELVTFFMRDLERELDGVRTILGRLVRADPEDLVFVPNATYAVNSILRSQRFSADDELLTTDHAYNACANVLRYVADRDGATLAVVKLPWPVADPGQITQAIVDAVSDRTRLLLLDHITSPTGLVLPAAEICAAMKTREVDVLVDGAHCVGHIDLDIPAVGATWYTSNCHKWLCAPKGSAFLWTRRDRQVDVRPACISHAANAMRNDRARYLQEFDWMGTDDPTPYLCIPDAIQFMEGLFPGGFVELWQRNYKLCREGRDLVRAALGKRSLAPDSMLGCLATVELPTVAPTVPDGGLYIDPLQEALFERGIEVRVVPWPTPGKRLVRISSQAYNYREQYERLATGLVALL